MAPLPLPDGTIGAGDRKALVGKYTGLTAEADGGSQPVVSAFVVAWAMHANTLLGGG